MNAKERFWARLRGRTVDRVPNLNIVMQFAAQHAGVPYAAFATDYRVLVQAQLQTAEAFDIDILSTLSDPYRETADFGACVTFPLDDLPQCHGALIVGADGWRTLQHWDPMQSTRMLDRIHAVELFRSLRGDEYPILGWVEGPLAELSDVATLSEALMMLLTDPEEMARALDFFTEQAIACALSQIKAGADVIGIGDAAASLIHVSTYRSLVQPFEQRIVHAIQQAGAVVKLHICGDVRHILPEMIATGADIIDIDYMVSYRDAVRLADGRCSICGNINPVSVLLQGDASQVVYATSELLASIDARCMIAGGCEVPRATPPANLRTMARVIAG